MDATTLDQKVPVLKEIKFQSDQQVEDFFNGKMYDTSYPNLMLTYILSKNLKKEQINSANILYGYNVYSWNEFFYRLYCSDLFNPTLNSIKKFILLLISLNMYTEANEIIDWMNGDKVKLIDL